MTIVATDLECIVGEYARGVRAQMVLLERLDGLSRVQHDASKADDLEQLVSVREEREQLLADILSLEAHLAPLRQTMAGRLSAARACSGFAEVTALHRSASDLVTRIMATDGETLSSLREAEASRRLAAQVIETGEATLAAYRRVVSPSLSRAHLFDRRG